MLDPRLDHWGAGGRLTQLDRSIDESDRVSEEDANDRGWRKTRRGFARGAG